MIKYIDIEQDAHGNWNEIRSGGNMDDLFGAALLTGGALLASLAIAVIGTAIIPGIEANTNRKGDPLGGLLRLANNLTDGLGMTGVSRQPKMTADEMDRYNREANEHERTRKRYFDPVTGEWVQL